MTKILSGYNNQKNIVMIEGSIPESFAEKLQVLEPKKDSLSINFVNSSGISIAKNAKASIDITICLKNNALLKELVIKSNKGNVNLTVPKGFQSNYKLSTSYGEIKAPEKHIDTEQEVVIELGSGNITILDK